MKIDENDPKLDSKLLAVKERIKERTGFVLTKAVCPLDDSAVLQVGYKKDYYEDQIPVLIISQSAESLFALFADIVAHFFGIVFDNCMVDFVIERSYSKDCANAQFRADKKDFLTALSLIYEFEDILVDDGCVRICYVSDKFGFEIQLTEHKLIHVYSVRNKNIRKVREFLRERNIPEISDMKLVTDFSHVHESFDALKEKFDRFVFLSGAVEEKDGKEWWED